MAQRIDEINISNFVNTGLTSPMARYTFNLQIKYVDNQGADQVYNASHTFPNDLTAMPLNVRRHFAEEMIKATVRVALGLNTWEDYV